MISLNTTLSSISYNYELLVRRKNLNAYKNIEEFSDVEGADASEGANRAASTQKATENVDLSEISTQDLMDLLKLEQPENRFAILMLLGRQDLENIVGLVDEKLLPLGLQFFSKEKLLDLVYNLPKEDIQKMLLTLMPQEKIMESMGNNEMSKFLESNKIQTADLINTMKQLPPQLLTKIYESIVGEPVKHQTKEEMIKSFEKMDHNVLVQGIQNIGTKDLRKFIAKLTTINPDLLQEFGTSSLIKPLMKLEKPDIMRSMSVLKPDQITKMLKTLPDEFLAQVATLVKPDKLLDKLTHLNPDLIKKLLSSK